MATWNDKPIDALEDNELRNAFIRIKAMNDAYIRITSSDDYKKKILNKPKPNANPAFVDLFNALSEEVTKRKLVI